MLFTYPSFINTAQQDDSRLLYNNIKILLQTSIKEIWYDTSYGTELRNKIKDGLDLLIVAEIQNNIEEVLMKYFSNDIILNYLDFEQDENKLLVSLNYKELRTGKFNTIETEQTFINTDTSLMY